MTSYCDFVANEPPDSLHRLYHDREYGFPLRDDNALFERLMLEVNQAGLSWTTILKKKENFARAYAGFDVDAVATFDERDRVRLLADPGIIRNRLKVNAAIENARRIQALQHEHGSFRAWLDLHVSEDGAPRTRQSWTRLFKATLVFTGGEIVNEFLLSTGYLPGAHSESCPTFRRVARQHPPWMTMRR